ncbi:MAG: MFS transporter, partial [Henriciella sp.]
IPIMLMTLVGPAVDITNRMTFLNLDPSIRTRLMTVYIVMMFIGGGMSSSAGTAVYDAFGWAGNGILAIAMSATLVALCVVGWLWRGRGIGGQPG